MKQFFKNVFASAFGVLIGVGIIFMIGFLAILSIVASSGGESEYKPKENTVFKLELKGSIVENNTSNPFAELFGDKEPTSLSTILRSIRIAKENENIKGIYIDATASESTPATYSAIRNALVDFKESGKFVIAYADNYSQGGYYVSSVADSVFVNPLGTVNLYGLASIGLFYPGLHEKLGVEYYIFKVGTFKGAVEPYFLKKFSDENRMQIESYQKSVWDSMTSSIQKSRSISKDALDKFINENGLFSTAQTVIDLNLIDGTRYRHEVEKAVMALAGQEEGKKLLAANVKKMGRIKPKGKVKKDKIAILYAEGIITESAPSMSMSEQIINEDVAEELTKLEKDDEVKAVVFRVNSRGGSAYISEQIWKRVEELKQVKPIVVSMGSYAASGGYYISCAANKIVAEPTTLTGSIGVYARIPNATGLFEKVGLTTDAVKTNPLADMGNFTRPMEEREKALIQASVEETYDLFITRCADGRGLTKEQIDFVGQGRVWTGEQALERGLVDELGGVDVAIKAAAELAEVENYSVISYNSNKDFLTKFLEGKLDEVKVGMIKNMLGEKFDLFKAMYNAPEEGIQALMPVEIEKF